METALLILALWFAIAGAAVWLDRRASNRANALGVMLELIVRELGMAPPPIVELEPAAPPPEPVRCPIRRDGLQCARLDGHEGDHSSRTGVSWAM